VEVQASPCEVDACSHHACPQHGLKHWYAVAAGAQAAHQLGACGSNQQQQQQQQEDTQTAFQRTAESSICYLQKLQIL
jgi:hypothetical protein